MSIAIVPKILKSVNLGAYARTRPKKNAPTARKQPKTMEDLKIQLYQTNSNCWKLSKVPDIEKYTLKDLQAEQKFRVR